MLYESSIYCQESKCGIEVSRSSSSVQLWRGQQAFTTLKEDQYRVKNVSEPKLTSYKLILWLPRYVSEGRGCQ